MKINSLKINKLRINSLKLNKIFYLFILLYTITFGKNSEIKIPEEYQVKKESFRTTWVASVENMNFPKAEKIGHKSVIRNSEEELKKDWLEILDTHEKLNFNAVIYQVSPTLDAMYKSKNRPWSHVLTGEQGKEPEWADSFDLLKWMIDETHKRGMEFHAWFNPYRVTHIQNKEATLESELKKLSDKNFARKNPELAYIFDGKVYLNPGEDEVIEHIEDTISEFIEKYDVDGVHFDDYFYPYKSKRDGKDWHFGDDYEDKKTFKNNSRGFKYIEKLNTDAKREEYKKEVENWRRDNVNKMVLAVKKVIDKYNEKTGRAVQWGISPFGIWDHKENDKNGSRTPKEALSSTRELYADSRKWVLNQEIDYIIPQIYWEFDNPVAPYGELTKWWVEQSKKSRTQLYIGHSSYKYLFAFKNKSWENPMEIPNQLKFNQQYKEIKGGVLFGYRDIVFDGTKDDVGTLARDKHIKLLENKYFITKALVPPKPWLDKKVTKPVEELHVDREKNGDYTIKFKDDLENDSRFYVVYIFNNKNFDTYDARKILKVVGRDLNSVEQRIKLSKADVRDRKYIGISIKDRAGVESRVEILNIN